MSRHNNHPSLAPRRQRRKWPWILFAILVLFVFIIIASNAGTPAQQTSSGVGSTVPLPDQSDAVDAPPPVTDDDAAAIMAFGQSYDSEGLQLTAGPPKPGNATFGATYCATVAYVNGTDDSVTFGIFDWKMVDTEGVESTATFAGGKTVDSGLGQGNLRPGGKKTGQVCFDKQGGGTPEQIIYQGGLFGEPVVWRK